MEAISKKNPEIKEKEMNLTINEEYFGDLLPFIRDDNITDITWNGRALWIDDLTKGRYKSELILDDRFIDVFSTRIANLANRNFNISEPLLEAETDDLRVSIIDDSVTGTKKSIAIRKTPAIRRLNETKMLNEGYANKAVIRLLGLAVKAHCSFIVTGDVGAGKTELIKYLTKFIPDYERTISIEDNYELRLSAINPTLDCVEIKVEPSFTYTEAIKASLRQLCKWMLLSEARSHEVTQLLEAASTGCSVMTTIHSDDVRKLPDRIMNMMGTDATDKQNYIYNFFDLAIKVEVDKTDRGIERRISQVAFLDRSDGENSLTVVYEDGKFVTTDLPKNILRKFKAAGMGNPLKISKPGVK